MSKQYQYNKIVEEAKKEENIVLLEEIRDLLKEKNVQNKE